MAGNLTTLVNRMVYWCRDVSLGYSQSDRWNIKPGGNADCSSLVIHCLKEAGFDTGSATYTGNMSAQLTARGWQRLPANGSPKKGDILLNDVHHVAVYLGGGQLAQASISEHGTAYGSGGDQTGQETNIRNYYDYPWDCYLRYAGTQAGQASTGTRATATTTATPKDDNMATHIIFTTGGNKAIGIANTASNTYHIYANTAEYLNNVNTPKALGEKVDFFKNYNKAHTNESANPNQFGTKA